MDKDKIYTLYIDDSGNRLPDKQDEDCRLDGMDHFALGGILVLESRKDEVLDLYQIFCREWELETPLHSTKIRGMREDFAWLEQSTKKRDVFLKELNNLLITAPVLGFAAVVHRPGYNKRYENLYGDNRWWMCKTAFAILVERACKYVDEQGGRLKIKFEQSGKKEDRTIISYMKTMKKDGMPFAQSSKEKYDGLTSGDFKRIVLGEPRRGTKNNLYLQLADLYLYPMAKRKYVPTYKAWVELYNNKKVIDSILNELDWDKKGIKYSCFE